MTRSMEESTALLQDRNGQKQQQHVTIIVDKYVKSEYEPILASDDYSSALELEELLLYVNDPWWQKLRRTLLATFWLVFLLILSTACLLAFMQHGKQCAIAVSDVESSTRITAAATIATSDLFGKVATLAP